MNKYEVLSVVGEGAYGVVLKCRDKTCGELVAIKKFKESDEDEIVHKTILREVKMLRMLKQDNIVRLKEAFRRKSKLYLVFEFAEKTLLEVLEARSGGLEPDEVRAYIHQLVQAVGWCHQHNTVHRDIKPENLLVSPGAPGCSVGKLKLCDFGFARTLPSTPAESITDYVSTRWYRAPELLLGSSHYGKGVDVWAIGCIMAELSNGQPLFPGDSDIDQLYIVQKMLGPLCRQHDILFLKNSRFAGLKFPDMGRPTTLDAHFRGSLSPDALDFLKGTLAMDPAKRLSCADCLAHPYLAGLSQRDQQQHAAPAAAAGRSSSSRHSSASTATKVAHPAAGTPPPVAPASCSTAESPLLLPTAAAAPPQQQPRLPKLQLGATTSPQQPLLQQQTKATTPRLAPGMLVAAAGNPGRQAGGGGGGKQATPRSQAAAAALAGKAAAKPSKPAAGSNACATAAGMPRLQLPAAVGQQPQRSNGGQAQAVAPHSRAGLPGGSTVKASKAAAAPGAGAKATAAAATSSSMSCAAALAAAAAAAVADTSIDQDMQEPEGGQLTARRRKRMASGSLGGASLRGGGRRDVEELHPAMAGAATSGSSSNSSSSTAGISLPPAQQQLPHQHSHHHQQQQQQQQSAFQAAAPLGGGSRMDMDGACSGSGLHGRPASPPPGPSAVLQSSSGMLADFMMGSGGSPADAGGSYLAGPRKQSLPAQQRLSLAGGGGSPAAAAWAAGAAKPGSLSTMHSLSRQEPHWQPHGKLAPAGGSLHVGRSSSLVWEEGLPPHPGLGTRASLASSLSTLDEDVLSALQAGGGTGPGLLNSSLGAHQHGKVGFGGAAGLAPLQPLGAGASPGARYAGATAINAAGLGAIGQGCAQPQPQQQSRHQLH